MHNLCGKQTDLGCLGVKEAKHRSELFLHLAEPRLWTSLKNQAKECPFVLGLVKIGFKALLTKVSGMQKFTGLRTPTFSIFISY